MELESIALGRWGTRQGTERFEKLQAFVAAHPEIVVRVGHQH